MLREAGKFSSYNYKSYSIRRIKDAFREHKNEVDAKKIDELVAKAQENLEVIKRQALISNLYPQKRPLVVE